MVETAGTIDALPDRAKAYPPTSLCLGYGVGTAGVSIVLNTVSVYFPALMATVFGLSPAIAGGLLMMSKIYDAATDVAIGVVSDKTRSPWGRRRPYLLAGAIGSALAILMIFVFPPQQHAALILYMGAALIVYSTGYSLFNVPYLAMPAEITRGDRERLKLVSFRTSFIGVGQLTALALSAWLIGLGGGGASGYRLMGVAMACLAGGLMLASFLATGRARTYEDTGRTHRLRAEDLRSLLENRPLFILLGSKLTQYVAFGVEIPVTLLFILNVTRVGYTGMIHLSVAENLTVFGSMPIWNRIGRRLGKRNAYVLAQALLIPAILSWFWVDAATTLPGLWWRGLLFGFGSAGALLMSITMLQDTIEYDRLKNGIERGGIFASFYSLNEKIGYAAGAAILGLGLGLGGYAATTNGQIIVQSAAALRSLYLIKTLVPSVVLAIGALLTLLYTLDDATLARMRERTVAVQ